MLRRHNCRQGIADEARLMLQPTLKQVWLYHCISAKHAILRNTP